MVDRLSSQSLYRWIILGIIIIIHVTSVYSGQGIQPLAPLLQSELHLKYVQIGMFTSIFFLGGFFLSIPMGWLVDRLGVYWTLAISQFTVGSFVLLVSFADSYLMICLCLFIAGMGYSTINPATGKAVMAWFPRKGRATAMGVKQTGIPIGGLLAAATLPTIALTLGWRKAFMISGTISLFSALLFLLSYREFKEEESQNKVQILQPSSLWGIFKNRDLMVLSCLVIIFMALQQSLGAYLVLFCKDSLHFSVIKSGYFLSLAHLGGAIGRLVWGPISDFYFGGQRKVVLMMIGTLSFMVCLFFAILPVSILKRLIVSLIFISGFCMIGWNGMYLTLVAELAGRDRAGMATGVSIFIGSLGMVLGPPFFGYIVDLTKSYSYSWFIFSIMIGLATPCLRWVREPRY